MVSPSIRQQRGPARRCMVRRSGLGLASLSAERQEQAPAGLKRTEAGRAALTTAVSRLQKCSRLKEFPKRRFLKTSSSGVLVGADECAKEGEHGCAILGSRLRWPMKVCRTCQEKYSDDISFCSRDGTALESMSLWGEGTIVRGRYRILGKIGVGGMGEVYKACHAGFDELRAIKVISSQLMTDETFVKRFKQEAFIARKLQHPNAVRVDDIDEAEDGRPFIVMEFIEGQSLKNEILSQGSLPATRVCRIAKQVLAALDAAHRLGMIHRDIKPDNIVLVNTPGGEQAKVLDFGIAKLREAPHNEAARATPTTRGVLMGTPQYMSPEQAMGKPGDEIDARSDLYSLGVVMYEMLTGELPFKADTVMDMLLAHMQKPPRPLFVVRPSAQIPETLASLVMRTLNKKPKMRPPDAAALIEEITRVEKGMPLTALRILQPVATPSQPTRGADRSAGAQVGAGFRPLPPGPGPVTSTWRTQPRVAVGSGVSRRRAVWTKGVLVTLLATSVGFGVWYALTHRRAAVAARHRAEGEALAKKLLFLQAEQEYRAALELDPQDATARFALGNVLVQEKEWDKAIATYHVALGSKPDNAELHNNLAVCLQMTGKTDTAISEYREALRLKPDYVEAHGNLGNALQQQGDADEAIAEYRAVLRLNAEDADMHYRLGTALNAKGKPADAVTEFREALRIRPGFALAHCALGISLYNQGDPGAGAQEIRTAYGLAPDDPDVRAAYRQAFATGSR